MIPAGTIASGDLIAEFQRMYREKWRYEWGKAEKGTVDCAGAFVWAYRQHGQRIAHGSNSIARRYCGQLRPISEAQPGWAAFKAHAPGEKGYSLPDKFAGDPDRNDYYHIGLVDADGKHILNAQSKSTGFVRSKAAGWSCCAPLNAVNYQEQGDDGSMIPMIVTTENGLPVKMRREPSTSCRQYIDVPSGTLVTAGDEQNGWRPITFGSKNGYMLAEFLVPYTESPATPTDLPLPAPLPAHDSVLIALPLSAAQALQAALNSVLGVG